MNERQPYQVYFRRSPPSACSREREFKASWQRVPRERPGLVNQPWQKDLIWE
jgi:hypothetical protein